MVLTLGYYSGDKYLILAFLWVAWCAVHSGLVSSRCTCCVQRYLPRWDRYSRLFFNGFSLATLIPVVLYTRSVGGANVLVWEGWLNAGRFLLLAISLLLFYLGARRYDMLQFVGVRQIRAGSRSKGLTISGGLDRHGVLGVVRHPWYLAGMMIVWTRDLGAADLVANAIIVGYFALGAFLEERKLVREFGEKYLYYQKDVSKLFPWKWVWGKMGKAFLR